MEGDEPMRSMLVVAQELHRSHVTALNHDDISIRSNTDAFYVADFRTASASAKPQSVTLVHARLSKNKGSRIVIAVHVPNARAFIQADEVAANGEISDGARTRQRHFVRVAVWNTSRKTIAGYHGVFSPVPI